MKPAGVDRVNLIQMSYHDPKEGTSSKIKNGFDKHWITARTRSCGCLRQVVDEFFLRTIMHPETAHQVRRRSAGR